MIVHTPHDTATGITLPAPVPARSTVCTAAALYLMTQHARRPCPLVAHAIADQLRRLAVSTAPDLSPVIRHVAASLLPLWRDTACGATHPCRH